MYGPPYSAGPPPPSASPGGRPTAALVGTAVMFVTIAACLAETAFEVMLAKSFTGYAASQTGDASLGDSMQPWLVVTIVTNALIAIGLGVGSALTMRRANAGRVVNWVVGAVCILVRLCCLSGLGMFGVFANALANTSSADEIGLDQMAPGWQIAGAAICSTVALVAVSTAMIIIGMPSVNAWFRNRKPVNQPPPGYPYAPYRRY